MQNISHFPLKPRARCEETEGACPTYGSVKSVKDDGTSALGGPLIGHTLRKYKRSVRSLKALDTIGFYSNNCRHKILLGNDRIGELLIV